MSARTQGTIKRLIKDKGFGFIADGEGQEYFFHSSSLANRGAFDGLMEGDKVTFSIAPPSSKGPRAEQVDPA